MNKVIAVLVSVLICLVFVFSAIAEEINVYVAGNIVAFGSYEQDNNLENGTEPVDWIVLETDGEQALLISRYCLDARPYNTVFKAMTWEKCTLRKWLNDSFLHTAFSAKEQARILPVTVINDNNPDYGTYGGEDTTDQIYLLSHGEVFRYFPTEESRRAQPTAYAVAQGAYYNETTGNTWWWLRTAGVRRIDACGVRQDGRVSGYGSRDVYRPSGTIRPVLWVSVAE